MSSNKIRTRIIRFAKHVRRALFDLSGVTVEESTTDEGKSKQLPKNWPASLKPESLLEFQHEFLNKYSQPSTRNKITNEIVAKTIEKWSKLSFNEDKSLITVGQALQYLGTDIFRNMIHDDTWVDLWTNEYDALDTKDQQDKIFYITIDPDLRFPNEYKRMHSLGGSLWKVERKVEQKSKLKDGRDAKHASETALKDYKFDYVLDNNGTFDELYAQIVMILKSFGQNPSKLIGIHGAAGAGKDTVAEMIQKYFI